VVSLLRITLVNLTGFSSETSETKYENDQYEITIQMKVKDRTGDETLHIPEQ